MLWASVVLAFGRGVPRGLTTSLLPLQRPQCPHRRRVPARGRSCLGETSLRVDPPWDLGNTDSVIVDLPMYTPQHSTFGRSGHLTWMVLVGLLLLPAPHAVGAAEDRTG